MRFTGKLTSRLTFITLLAITAVCPFAISIPWVRLYRWLASAPVENPGFLPSPADNQRWFVIFGAATCALLAIIFARRHALTYLRLNLVAWCAVAWFTITLISGVMVPQFQSQYQALLLQFAFMLLFLSAATQKAATNQLRLLQATLCVATLPIAAIALMQNAGINPLPYSEVVPGTLEVVSGKHLISSTFGHPNYMGSYLAPIIMLAVGLTISSVPWLWRGLGAVAAIAGLLALLVGGTRGPLLAVAAGLPILFVLNVGTRLPGRRIAIIAVLALVSIIAAIALVPALRPAFEFSDRLFASKEIASRAFYWIVGLEMFKQAPIFGIGAGQFDTQFWWMVSRLEYVEPDGAWYFILEGVIRGVRPGNMHNDHLQVLVEAGIVGAFAWACLWAAVGRRSVAIRTSPGSTAVDHQLNAAYAAAFTAIGVDALFSFPFHLPCSGALFWVACGLWSSWHFDFN